MRMGHYNDVKIQRMSSQCGSLFCGCEYYQINKPIEAKVYLCIAFILFVITASVLIGSKWFIFKDYYPMKQRSPILCILMIIIISGQLILYPLAYTYNYFTRNWGQFKYPYRIIFYAVDGSLYFIYLLRSLRLVYAHEIDPSRSRTWIFKFFKHEFTLLMFVVGMIAIKLIPIVATDLQTENIFLTFIDVNFYTFGEGKEIAFEVKETIHEFIWLCILIYCIWLQTLVHDTYSMKNELLLVFLINMLLNTANILLYWNEIGSASIIFSICKLYPDYPILQISRDISVLSIFVISIFVPLLEKRIYHMMLPIGRHHNIVKTMRDFLMVHEFMQIFTSYMEHLDQAGQTSTHTQLLQNWKRIMVIKYRLANQQIEDYDKLISIIKEMVDRLEEGKEGKDGKDGKDGKILRSIQESVMSHESNNRQLEVREREKLLEEVGRKIDELELAFLQKLDNIYKDSYRKTKSYFYLKMQLARNKRININMITMGMAVMVENRDTS